MARNSEDAAGTTNTRLVVTLLAVSFTFLVATLPRSVALIAAAFIQHLVSDPLDHVVSYTDRQPFVAANP